jgi:hypothetical protein
MGSPIRPGASVGQWAQRPNAIIAVSLVCAAVCAAVWIATGHVVPVIQPDSAGYIGYAPIRSPGYPLLIKLLSFGHGWLRPVIAFQLALAAWAQGSLAKQIAMFSGRRLVGWLTLALLWGFPDYNEFHFSLMTESVSGSLRCLYLALLIRFIRDGRAYTIALCGLVAGLDWLVRPTGLAVVVATVMTLAVLRHEGIARAALRPAGLALGVAISVWLAGAAIHRVVHGPESQSLTGVVLFSRGLIAAGSLPPNLDPGILLYVGRLRDVVRPILRSAAGSSFRLQAKLQDRYATYAQYQLWRDQPEFRTALDSFAARNRQPPDQALETIGVALLASNWREVLRQGWVNFVGLWTIVGPTDVDEYNRFMDSHYPLPLIESLDGMKRRPVPNRLQQLGNLVRAAFVWAICLLSAFYLLLPFVARRSPFGPRNWQVAAGTCAAILANLSFAQVAYSNVAIARYFLNSWPAVVVLMVAGFSGVAGGSWRAAWRPQTGSQA